MRIFIADLDQPGQVKLVHPLGKREASEMRVGECSLMKLQDDVAVVKLIEKLLLHTVVDSETDDGAIRDHIK